MEMKGIALVPPKEIARGPLVFVARVMGPIVLGILVSLVAIPFSVEAQEIKANCELTLEAMTSKIGQDPLKSVTKIVLTSIAGLTGERHRFDLTGTDFECEAAFSGFDVGTFLNCWKTDMSMGVIADRTSVKRKSESSVPNILAVAGPSGRTKAILTCVK